MNKFITFIFCVFLSGCVSVSFEEGIEYGSSLKDTGGLTSIGKVYVGMAKSEVVALMGDQVQIGYENMLADSGPKPIALQSPYKVETLGKDEDIYEVLYYFTHIQKSDGIVSDEELTPLIFENDRLIGKGLDFLFKLKNTLK